MDTGTIIVSILGAIQVGDKVHVSRKHTTLTWMRQEKLNICGRNPFKSYQQTNQSPSSYYGINISSSVHAIIILTTVHREQYPLLLKNESHCGEILKPKEMVFRSCCNG